MRICAVVSFIAALSFAPASRAIAQNVTLDFDSVSIAPGVCADASSYLSSFGISFVAISPGANGIVCNVASSAITPVSGGNVFFGVPPVTNTDVSYELRFSAPQAQVGFTRAAVAPHTSMVGWNAVAYDAAGTVLSSISQEAMFPGPPAATFTLSGPGIVRIRVDAFNSAARTFNHPPIDNLILATTAPTVTFSYGAGNRSLDHASGTPLPSTLPIGISFGAHDRTLHLQAVVSPASEADRVMLTASAKLTLVQGVADTNTGIIPFDLVGNTPSEAATPGGDSMITATSSATGTAINHQRVSVVVPARTLTPSFRESATVHGFNGLFNNTTVPPFSDVFDPYVQRASMYIMISHVIVGDQFGQPIGDADLYGGARIFEGGVDIGTVLLSNSTYEDRLGRGTAVGPPVLRTDRQALNWLHTPVPRPAREGTFAADVDDIQIDGNFAWTLAIVGRQLRVSRTGRVGEAFMEVIWP